jgi:YidC/Oxa1 family membrane protein insertase
VIVEGDTLDLRSARFETSSVDRVRLQAGGEPQVVELEYADPTGGPVYRVAYTFHADTYLVEVRGTVEGVGRGILMTDLGWGLAYNEVDEASELRSTAYVVNHLQRGIQATSLSDVSERTIEDGPFLWVASKSRYFVVGLLPPLGPGGGEYLGGVAVGPLTDRENRAALAVTQSVGGGGFEYQVYAGPQDYQQLAALGNDFQEVSPVGWRWLRPVLRPIVAGIMWVLVFFHVNLSIGYGWVLVLVGVLMRIVLFPLNHKAMRAQLKNMAVQPLLKDIQTRYKDQPERMQKELMKLYREHGFNPLAGCWPILLPWPVLIALFFVFQNTIELRGVPFAWLPDLSAKDPIFVLPLLLGVSMFLLQWISMRAVEDASPQMKMMLWTMPIVMVVIFVNFPSGLNLYYLTANIATLPQSWWIARERKRVQAVGPPSPAKG